VSVAELGRKRGISSATFYAWKAGFGGMEVSEPKRLNVLETDPWMSKRITSSAATLQNNESGLYREALAKERQLGSNTL
jgi:putative transposase